MSTDDLNHGVEPGLKGEVEPLLAVLKALKEQGLTDTRLVHVFMHHRIQPLMARGRLMFKYSGLNDPNCHSIEPLTLSEIKARVKVITPLSSWFFIDEDFPHSFLGAYRVVW